jgi:hypothetical protein
MSESEEFSVPYDETLFRALKLYARHPGLCDVKTVNEKIIFIASRNQEDAKQFKTYDQEFFDGLIELVKNCAKLKKELFHEKVPNNSLPLAFIRTISNPPPPLITKDILESKDLIPIKGKVVYVTRNIIEQIMDPRQIKKYTLDEDALLSTIFGNNYKSSEYEDIIELETLGDDVYGDPYVKFKQVNSLLVYKNPFINRLDESLICCSKPGSLPDTTGKELWSNVFVFGHRINAEVYDSIKLILEGCKCV